MRDTAYETPRRKWRKLFAPLMLNDVGCLQGRPLYVNAPLLMSLYSHLNQTDKFAQGIFQIVRTPHEAKITGQDLGSILTFLRICSPLDNEDFYKRMVLRPLKDGDPSGAELLRVR